MVRSFRERVIQTLAYEAGGLLIATPLYSLMFGQGTSTSFLLLAVVAIACLVWSGIHNTAFDIIENRFTGRLASDRSQAMRVGHALLHEITSILVTTPLIMFVGNHSFRDALLMDIGITVIYSIYAYFFHIGFDYFRPVAADAAAQVATEAQTAAFVATPPQPNLAQSKLGWPVPQACELPRALGSKIIAKPELLRAGPHHLPEAASICGHVATATCHVSFHAFPARGFVTVDFYSGENDRDEKHIARVLKKAFALHDASVFVKDDTGKPLGKPPGKPAGAAFKPDAPRPAQPLLAAAE